MVDVINIKGQAQQQIALAANTAGKSAPLPAGTYDVWAAADIYVRTAPLRQGDTLVASPNRAEDVTIANGYQIYANNTVSITVQEGDILGAISASVTTVRLMRTGN